MLSPVAGRVTAGGAWGGELTMVHDLHSPIYRHASHDGVVAGLLSAKSRQRIGRAMMHANDGQYTLATFI